MSFISNAIDDKKVKWISYLMFIVVFLLAFIYAKERLFADASYYFFHSINQGYPQVDHDRITLFLAQIFPLLGSYIGLSVKVQVYLHSIGHILFFYGLFYYVFHYRKMTYHGLAIAVLTVTGVTTLFFSPMLEIWYGIALAIVWDAEIKRNESYNIKSILFSSLLLIFILLSHPENFGVVIFILGFNYISKKLSIKMVLYFLGILLVAFVYKWLTFSEYETGKVNWGMNGEENQFYDKRTQLSYYLDWFQMLFKNYYDALFIIFAGIFWALFQKKYSLIIWTVLCLLGFSFIVHYTNKSDEFTRYIESVHMPLVAISLLIYIDLISKLKKENWRNYLLIISILFFSIRVYFINEMGKVLHNRVVLLETFIDESIEKQQFKSIVTEQDFEGHPIYFNSWSVSIETLILSAMKYSETPCSIISTDDLYHDENQNMLNTENFVFRRWEIFPNEWLNSRFYKLPEKEYEFLR